MKRTNCDIIRDLLPLYVDGVVSETTKDMVEAHLNECEDCRKEAAMMQKNMHLPANETVQKAEANSLKGIKKRFFKKKVVVAVLSACVTLLAAVGIYSYMAMAEDVVPYDASMVKIEEKADQLFIYFTGEQYDCSYMLEPTEMTVDGEKKKVAMIYFSETPLSKIKGNTEGEKEMLKKPIYVGDKADFDLIYYGEYDTSLLNEPEKLLEDATLLWEKK